MLRNVDRATVEGFGREWEAFDQTELGSDEHHQIFERYFAHFPFDELCDAEGFDLGSGSGRWAALVGPRVKKLHCVDPASRALEVSRRRLVHMHNVEFHCSAADEIPLTDGSQDFGYSLGVLHHIPDTEQAMRNCVAKLRPGAPFLVYLYYRFDNRPRWYRALWRLSDVVRRVLSRLPFALTRAVTELIAITVYLPLSRGARIGEKLGLDVTTWPLGSYRSYSFYTLRTDALDRFGTRLEQRFSKAEIISMMGRCGLTEIRFNEHPPYWVAFARKQPAN